MVGILELRRWGAIATISVATVVICRGSGAAQEASSDGKQQAALVPLPATVPDPKENPATREKIELGKQLFFDPRLSGDNTMSCGTCHLPEKALTDGLARGKGKGGQTLGRNTPTLLNIGFQTSFFWDGRARTLEEQALGPVQSAEEMHQDLEELELELNGVPGYVEQFQRVFQTRVTHEGIARALAAFERTLVTRNSPFDRYLAGDKTALGDDARRGLAAFTGGGCVRCHNGPLLSDGKFYRLGIGLGDKGRELVTGKKEDRYKFRTPSLREVARTAPYMHDGSRKTLASVVEFYYRLAPGKAPDGIEFDVQPLLGESFSQIADIVAFLEALTGDLPEIKAPELPK
jgi:cytochrome c peroxidase